MVVPIPSYSPEVHPLGELHMGNIKKYGEFTGKILAFFGMAVKVHDSSTKEVYYLKTKEIAQELIGKNVLLPKQSNNRICQRILEITAPDTRKGASQEKIRQLFNRFYSDKTQQPLETSAALVNKFEEIKLDLSDIKPIY
jgi:hypothetical protein